MWARSYLTRRKLAHRHRAHHGREGSQHGRDPSATPAKLEAMVRAGRIHWFIVGSGFGGQMVGGRSSTEIARWVRSNFTSRTVGG
jgi:hypothetical protein